MIDLVLKYSNYIDELPEIIEKSPHKTADIIEKLQMPEAVYLRKLKNKSFSVKEVEKLTEILFPNDVFLAEMDEPLAEFREEINAVKRDQYEKMMDKVKKEFPDF